MTVKLKVLFLIGFALMIAHGLEEYFNQFYLTDWTSHFFLDQFITMQPEAGIFLGFQFALWIAFLIAGVAILGSRWRLRLMVIPAIIFIFEIHHVVLAVGTGDYYPGLVLSLIHI